MDEKEKRRATPVAIAKTVLSAFFGVRKRGDHESETVQLTPVQIVLAGIVAGLCFVGGLILLVRFILGRAMG